MPIDPDNPIAALCARGMAAEGEGRRDDARALFLEAWTTRRDDYEGAVAAHYVARHQSTPEETLRWNALALEHAEAASQDKVGEFYASLYLNLAHSHEVLGQQTQAVHYASHAARAVDVLPPGPYREFVRRGIEALHQRLGLIPPS
jgi:hypothetical protein